MEDIKPWGFCETPEIKCTANSCDEYGCQNRKRHLVSGASNHDGDEQVTS